MNKYTCNICNYSTTEKSNLNRHLKSVKHLKKEIETPYNNIIENKICKNSKEKLKSVSNPTVITQQSHSNPTAIPQ